MTSACDSCRLPGRCCFGFTLSSPELQQAETMLEVFAVLSHIETPLRTLDGWKQHGQRISLPFQPLYRAPGANGTFMWRFWCINLGRDGRCLDYENRPVLCVAYKPKQDALCAEHPDSLKPPLGVQLTFAG